MKALLEVDGVTKTFGGVAANVDVSFAVAAGEILGLIGPNGAGKSTLLRAIAGQVAVTGRIMFQGIAMGGMAPHRVTRLGVGLVPEGRRLFPRLSVEDNLRLGA